MTKRPATNLTRHRYKRHRFPAERGIEVSFQTVSEWACKFGREYACSLRQRSRGSFSDKWHLDEMAVAIKGKNYWLWRVIDADGYVLDALIQSRRNERLLFG